METGKCRADPTKELITATSYVAVPKKSDEQLKAAIEVQPTCVSIDADCDDFMFYESGIFNSKNCGIDLDHAVTAVGYGSENG